MKKIFLVLIAFLLTFSPFQVNAHNLGASFEQQVGEYLIDIGYDPEDIEAGYPTLFDFNIYDKNKENLLEFESLWVRIDNEGATEFATGIHKQDLGATTMVYSFNDAGNYTMYIRFEGGEETLAELDIPVEVLEPTEDGGSIDLVVIVAATIVAALLISNAFFLIVWLKSKKK